MLGNSISVYSDGWNCTILLLTLIGFTLIYGKLDPRVAMSSGEKQAL